MLPIVSNSTKATVHNDYRDPRSMRDRSASSASAAARHTNGFNT
ncbi:hypothetical protein [Caballeronia glebae]|jgi:hypothetical protein|nr:hypothetical protein [Caballeronia glebae]